METRSNHVLVGAVVLILLAVLALFTIWLARLGSAQEKQYDIFFKQSVDGLALQPIITGRYRDEFVCVDDGWRFARRQFAVDHVGDLSHHLTYEVPRT